MGKKTNAYTDIRTRSDEMVELIEWKEEENQNGMNGMTGKEMLEKCSLESEFGIGEEEEEKKDRK